MHYYNFNIGDYRRDAAHLSRLEHSIYRDLIDWYYLDEVSIPLATQSVMRRLRLGSEEEANALQNVLNDFFERENDGWHHTRIDADIAKYHSDCEKNRQNGKRGGRPKANADAAENPLGYESVTTGIPDQTQLKGNQEPITNNQEPIIIKERRKKIKKEEVNFSTFLADCSLKNEKPIRDYKPLWNYQETAGIPFDYVVIAWHVFLGDMQNKPEKKQADWRMTFKNYVANDYLKLWAVNREGEYFLTPKGKQAELYLSKKEAA